MADQTITPDYELAEELLLEAPAQMRAIASTARSRILSLLGQRAASTKQIAESLGMPKGTVGHHLKMLEAAGLIRVVRTRQVRAITEKYYGRVARTFRVTTDDDRAATVGIALSQQVALLPLRQAIKEAAPSADADDPTSFLIVHARVSANRARKFAKQVEELAREFTRKEKPGEKVYGFVAGVYLTHLTITEEADDGS